jgi:hypothetical protein
MVDLRLTLAASCPKIAARKVMEPCDKRATWRRRNR